MIAAAVLFSGAVAFAVAASTAPPSADHIKVVVTDRPMRDMAAPPAPAATVSVAAVPTAPAPVAEPVQPRVAPSAEVKTRTLRAVVKSVVTRTDEPQVITVPSESATSDGDEDDEREVVTPDVRDDTDHDADDAEHDGKNSTPKGD